MGEFPLGQYSRKFIYFLKQKNNNIQLTSLSIYGLYGLHTARKLISWKGSEEDICFYSSDVKDDRAEQKRIFNGSEFQTSGAWYGRGRAPAVRFRWTLES